MLAVIAYARDQLLPDFTGGTGRGRGSYPDHRGDYTNPVAPSSSIYAISISHAETVHLLGIGVIALKCGAKLYHHRQREISREPLDCQQMAQERGNLHRRGLGERPRLGGPRLKFMCIFNRDTTQEYIKKENDDGGGVERSATLIIYEANNTYKIPLLTRLFPSER